MYVEYNTNFPTMHNKYNNKLVAVLPDFPILF